MSSPVWLSDELSAEIKQDENFHENAQHAIKDVFNGRLDITTLVERLSGVLTDVNPEFRARGMQFFSKVLSLLPNDYLTETQLSFIAKFYVDRLKDNHRVIPPVLEGVLALSKMKNIPKDAPSQCLMAIFNNVPCQQQVRTDRNNIYNIIQTFLQSQPNELRSMGPDIVCGVISAMDGERDPRNLMLLFSILPSFLKWIPLGHLSEEMFEVIACYYPIDFNSPPDDPNAISRNDLARELCLCLSATPTFAGFCISLLLEKLDSKLKLAKMDSLRLLKQCCDTFSPADFDPHLQAVWSALQIELSNKGDHDVIQAAHDALLSLVGNLCSVSSESKIGESFLNRIFISMKILLADAKTKNTLELPLRIFLTTARASEKSCIFITENVVPLLMVHYHLNLDESLHGCCLAWFSLVFELCKNWNVDPQMWKHFGQLSAMCMTALNSSNVDLKISSLRTLAAVAEIIEVGDLPALCRILDGNIHGGALSISESSEKCLLELAKKNPKLYSDFILEKLNFEEIINDNSLLEKRFNMLCSLSSISVFSECIIPKLLNTFTKYENKACILISVLLKNFEDTVLLSDDKIREIHLKYDLLNYILRWSDQNMNQNAVQTLDCVSKLLIRIMRTLESNLQSDILEKYVPNYVNQLSVNSKFIVPLEALLNSSRHDVKIVQIDDVLSRAMDLALNDSDNFINHKSCLLIANILNKHGNDEDFLEQYNKLKEILRDGIDNNMNETICSNSIVLCSWVTKSLLLSGNPEAPVWFGKMVQTLNDEKWGLHTARGFKLIMTDSLEVLNSDSFCSVSFLFRQKVFHLFVQLAGDQRNNVHREPCLLAWAYIIQSVPKTVLQLESSKISSILIESLDFGEHDLLLATLATVSFLVQAKNSHMADSLQSLIPRCLKLTTFKGSLKVRMGSLQCLFDIGNSYSTVILLPYKDDIIIQLAACLDDPKRLVRRAAVKARTRWFLVGSPGEDKIIS